MAKTASERDYQQQIVNSSYAESERIKDVRCWTSFCSFFSHLLSSGNCCSCQEQARVENSSDVLQTSASVGSAPHKALLSAASGNSTRPLQSSASSKSHSTTPTGKALGRTVTGTIFGYRKGKVTFCVQEDPKASPSLLLELAMPTDILVREMASGLLRIALECETKGRDKMQDENDGPVKPGLHKPTPLILEPVWSMYCNGRKVGFAIRRICSDTDRSVLAVIEQVSMGAGVIPVDEQHRPVVLSPDARSRSKQSSRRTSPERHHRTEGHRWFPSVSRSARTSPERERRMGGPGSRDQSYRSSPDHRYQHVNRDRASYRSSPEHILGAGRERRSSLDMRRVADDRDMTPVKTRSFDRPVQHERFEDRLKGGHERSKSGDRAIFEATDKSPRRSPRRALGFESDGTTQFSTPPSNSKSDARSNSKSDYGTPLSDDARRSLESEEDDDTATSHPRIGGKANGIRAVSNGDSAEGEVSIGVHGPRFTKMHKEDDHIPINYHRIDEHLPLENGKEFPIRPSKMDVYNDLDDDQFGHRLGDGHVHKPSQVPSEELMYMRARYEHVVGSADAESFHMINPDGTPGQELSVFFLRI